MPMPYPVLDFTLLCGDQILVSLDAGFGSIRTSTMPIPSSVQIPPDNDALAHPLRALRVSKDGTFSDTSTNHHDMIASLEASLTQPHLLSDLTTASKLQLYPDLPILPRWPGMEDDDEDEGAVDVGIEQSNSDARSVVTKSEGRYAPDRTWTAEELEMLSTKALGRLKSQGVNVATILLARKKAAKSAKYASAGLSKAEKGDADA